MRSVRKYAEACGGTPDNFYKTENVTVSTDDGEYIYRNVTVQISYDVGYMQYRVAIIWEEDESAPFYKELGLHGVYNTNYQMFSFSGSLNFTDGGCSISLLVS